MCVQYMKMEKWRLQEREQGIRALAAWKTGHKQEFKVEYPTDILRLVKKTISSKATSCGLLTITPPVAIFGSEFLSILLGCLRYTNQKPKAWMMSPTSTAYLIRGVLGILDASKWWNPNVCRQ